MEFIRDNPVPLFFLKFQCLFPGTSFSPSSVLIAVLYMQLKEEGRVISHIRDALKLVAQNSLLPHACRPAPSPSSLAHSLMMPQLTELAVL